MKILILAEAGSVHTVRWVEALENQGAEVVVATFRENRDAFKGLKSKQIPLHISIDPDRSSSFTKLSYLKAVAPVKKIISTFRPDILHAFYATSYGLTGALTGFHPLVVSVWGSDVLTGNGFLKNKLLRFVFQKADLIQSTSRMMARHTETFTGKSIGILPFGIDTGIFNPLQKPKNSDEIVIGTIKWLQPVYGIDYLIRAFAILLKRFPDKNIKLMIVGDGPARDEYQALAKKLETEPFITFAGRIERERIPDFLHRMDIFAALSLSESFGVSVLEAEACGLPVVVTAVGGLPEVVQESKTGFLVPPRDAEAAADALAKLIENPSLRASMGRQAAAFVKANYRWQDQVEQQLKIYKDLLP